MKIKKCGEMARKLRFFKEQMSKAGVAPSIKSTTLAGSNVDDLEVYWIFLCLVNCESAIITHNGNLFSVDKTWRT